MVKREELLETLSQNSEKELVSFILQCKREGSTCLSDALSSCSKEQLGRIWERTHAIVVDRLNVIVTEVNVEDKEKLDLIQSLILLMMGMLSVKDVYMCEPMFQTAFLLKDCYQVIPSSRDPLKNALAKLFEEWWMKNLYGRQHLMNTTLTFILDRSIDLKYKDVAAVVNKVWSLHEVIPLINLHADGSQDFKELLNQCFISTQYIRNEQGIKFLAFMLTEDEAFTQSSHQIIKRHLVHAPRSWPVRYGEVYFRAWQHLYKTGDPRLLEFEHNCIQDLMSVAIHAQPVVSPALRKILGYFHRQKKQKGVDEMLCRLYEPLIWRMMKVSNYQIRKNAVQLFFDAFPMKNPEHNKEEAQQFQQKQLELFNNLLYDPNPSVRSEAVIGVFQVMKDYWELFSADCLKSLFKVMINDMQCDGSSKTLRERVIRGFILLLDNPLSHLSMKLVLPKLEKSFHDKAEVVRVAMADLLIKVKMIREIRYWDLVPLEHMLERLVHDEDPVRRRLVQLLFDNVVPLNRSADVKIERCLNLIKTNRAACREFYILAVKHMSLKETVDYILTLCKGVLMAVKKAKANRQNEDTNEPDTQRTDNTEATGETTEDVNENSDGEDEETDDLNVNNTEIMLGLLESMGIMWYIIRGQLFEKDNSDLKKYLDKRLGVALIEIETVLKDEIYRPVLIRMSGYLPANYIPTINRTWFPKLRNMTEESTKEEFGEYVMSLCEINRASDLFELALDWIKPSLDGHNSDTASSKKNGQKKRRVRIVDPIQPQPLLGIKLLDFMFNDKRTQSIVLEDHMEDVLKVKDLLKLSMRTIQEHLNSKDRDRDRKEEDISVKAFSLYANILYTLQAKDAKTYPYLPEVMEILTWTERHILPSFPEEGGGEADTGEDIGASMTVTVLSCLLDSVCALFRCGVADRELSVTMVEICTHILIKDTDLQFLPEVLRCLCEVVDIVRFSMTPDLRHCLDNVLPAAIGQVCVSLSTFMKDQKEKSIKVLHAAKSNMTDLMRCLYSSDKLNDSLMERVMATLLATVLAEMGFTSQQYELEETTDISMLPMLSKWLVEIIQKKPLSVKLFVNNLQDFCNEARTVTEIHTIHSMHGVVHLLGTLKKSIKHTPGAIQDVYTSVEMTMDNLTKAMSEEESENYKDVLMSISKKMEECKAGLQTSNES